MSILQKFQMSLEAKGITLEQLLDVLSVCGLRTHTHLRKIWVWGNDGVQYQTNLTFEWAIPRAFGLLNHTVQGAVIFERDRKTGTLKNLQIILTNSSWTDQRVDQSLVDDLQLRLQQAIEALLKAVTELAAQSAKTVSIPLPAGLTQAEIQELAVQLGARPVVSTGRKQLTANATAAPIPLNIFQVAREPVMVRVPLKVPGGEQMMLEREVEPHMRVVTDRKGAMRIEVPQRIYDEAPQRFTNMQRAAIGLTAVKTQAAQAEPGSTVKPVVIVDRQGVVDNFSVEWQKPAAPRRVIAKGRQAISGKPQTTTPLIEVASQPISDSGMQAEAGPRRSFVSAGKPDLTAGSVQSTTHGGVSVSEEAVPKSRALQTIVEEPPPTVEEVELEVENDALTRTIALDPRRTHLVVSDMATQMRKQRARVFEV